MRRFAAALALVAMSVPPQAIAAEWIYVTSSTGKDSIYYDNGSIRTISPGIKKYWMKFVDKDGSDYVELYYTNCWSGTSKIIQSIKHYTDGSTYTQKVNSIWRDDAPDSIGSTVNSVICHKR
jgi:hypothetical protein